MNKSNDSYKSIGEVAKILNLVNKKKGSLNTHTIRFWEKEFNNIKPKIFAGKRRYYDNKSIEVLKKIKFLLKNQGLTIKGAKKVLSTSESFRLDDLSNKPINVDKNIVLKKKISKISKLVKEIKGLK
jgi:DNA-binding transcriptional MerR regulator|tara:strand:+ start:1511 stop:1891 length:381 start_codon:yes stop_codon:yes gene_type:complete